MNEGDYLKHERLIELFDYDPDTGVFIRKVATANVKAGKITGSVNTGGHLGFRVDRRMYLAHRLAWFYVYGEWPDSQIDHINGVKTDNRIENLRKATYSINAQNLRNARKDNKTGFLGVCWKKSSKKFIAQIQIAGRVCHLGMFETAEKAHEAYITAKRKHHIGCTI